MDLISEFLKMNEENLDKLTVKQRKVYDLYFVEGKTQIKIGQILGIQQPSVNKSIWGNFDSVKRKNYGGIVRKLRKRIEPDQLARFDYLVGFIRAMNRLDRRKLVWEREK